ncbi:MAG: fibrinogen-like YCDxxxxGGGW domain-containing protein [Rhodoluna sp.]
MKNKSLIGAIVGAVLLASGIPAMAANVPASVPGKTSNPQCSTASNASEIAKLAVAKSASKDCRRTDGLSRETAGRSALQIHNQYPRFASGVYWIKNENINNGEPFQIYADMETDGGGWTLILANSTRTWSYAETRKVNELQPPVNPADLSNQAIQGKYSILEFADFIKDDGPSFQYRIDAGEYQKCGGIWTAPKSYSFTSTSNLNTNIARNVGFPDSYGNPNWDYNDSSIEKRMPYLSEYEAGHLTTSVSSSENWWGTLVQDGGWVEPGTFPWMAETGIVTGSCRTPSIIWYWVR